MLFFHFCELPRVWIILGNICLTQPGYSEVLYQVSLLSPLLVACLEEWFNAVGNM
jgi:hypothetical protein